MLRGEVVWSVEAVAEGYKAVVCASDLCSILYFDMYSRVLNFNDFGVSERCIWHVEAG